MGVNLSIMDAADSALGEVFLLKAIASDECSNLTHGFPVNWVTMPPPK